MSKYEKCRRRSKPLGLMLPNAGKLNQVPSFHPVFISFFFSNPTRTKLKQKTDALFHPSYIQTANMRPRHWDPTTVKLSYFMKLPNHYLSNNYVFIWNMSVLTQTVKLNLYLFLYSYYNWRTHVITSNSSPNFDTISDSDGLHFINNEDRMTLSVDPEVGWLVAVVLLCF